MGTHVGGSFFGGSLVGIDHVVRLCVRVHAGAFHRETDLAVPITSSVAEIAEEIAGVVGAPPATRPWQAMTAAGVVIDPHEPLGSSGITDGAVVVLEPEKPRQAPVPRDAAEALVAAASRRSAGLPAAFTQVVSVCGILAVVAGMAAFVPAWVACVTGAVVGGVLCAWRRDLYLVTLIVPVLAAGGGALWVLDAGWDAARWDGVGLAPTERSVLFGTLGALAGGVAGVAVSVATRPVALGREWLAGAAVVGVSGVVGAGAGYAGGLLAGLVAALIVALCCAWAAPAVATGVAGLHTQRLPAAGEDLEEADWPLDQVDERAAEGLQLHAAIVIAAAVVTAAVSWFGAAAAAAAQLSGLWFSLACCVAVASGMHAVRHVDPRCLWSHLAIALTLLLGAATHVSGSVLGGAAVVTGTLLVGSGLWGPRLESPEPTTLVWWERAESIALAAAIPLAAHLGGVFTWIRGLG